MFLVQRRHKHFIEMANCIKRSFAITIPYKKLHFIDHEVHGKVYPVACFHKDSVRPKTKISLLFSVTGINSLALYSLFVEPILLDTIWASFCNPLFLVPSLIANYFILTEYSIMLYAKREMAINMWLLPNGRQVIVDTYNGESRKINIKDFYNYKERSTKFKLGGWKEIYHGTNNYLFMTGNSQYFDKEVFNSIVDRKFVDTKNVVFDIDVDKSFTWDIDELLKSDIKRKQRKVSFKYLQPLTKDEKDDQVKKLKSVDKISHRLRNINLGRYVNHNMFHNWKSYNLLKSWTTFNKCKMQGSVITFTKDVENVNTFHKYNAHTSEQKKYDENNKKMMKFEAKRKLLLKRPTTRKL